jgi:phosphatidylglycerophosphate synthase
MIKKGNKLPIYYDDVVDVQLKRWIDVINPLFKRVGFTPNGITTLSLVFGLGMCYLYYKRFYFISAICCLLSYFFDVMDGYFARLYNMGSLFGSYYDVISDWTVGILFLFLFLTSTISTLSKTIIVTMSIILNLIILYHYSCQENYTKTTNPKFVSDGLSFVNKVKCRNHNHMKYTRFFGTGTLFIWISFIILLHYKL